MCGNMFLFNINSSLAKNNILSHACLGPRSAAECVLELRVAVKETGQSRLPTLAPQAGVFSGGTSEEFFFALAVQ